MSFHHFKSHIYVGDEKIEVVIFGTRSRYYPGTYYNPPEGGEFSVNEIKALHASDVDKIPDIENLDEHELERIESEGYNE